VDSRALAARLPRSAHEIAREVVRMLDTQKSPTDVPVTVRTVTVQLTRIRLIASETLVLAAEQVIFP
jgi:hypothetical protein